MNIPLAGICLLFPGNRPVFAWQRKPDREEALHFCPKNTIVTELCNQEQNSGQTGSCLGKLRSHRLGKALQIQVVLTPPEISCKPMQPPACWALPPAPCQRKGVVFSPLTLLLLHIMRSERHHQSCHSPAPGAH